MLPGLRVKGLGEANTLVEHIFTLIFLVYLFMISFKGEASSFPDSSVVKTLHFHCKRHGLIHNWGTKITHVCHVTKKTKRRSGKTWSEPLSKISLVNVTHRRQVSEHLLISCVLGIPFEGYYSPP